MGRHNYKYVETRPDIISNILHPHVSVSLYGLVSMLG